MFHHRATSKHPRGLAPLEMVLAIPFLLGIMALMVCYGNVACWKIRALTVARHSIWGNLSPNLHSPWVPYDRKTGFNDPRPSYWPANKTSDGPIDVGDAPEVTGEEAPRHPVVRGLSDNNPIFQVDNGQSVTVNDELLDPSRRMRAGTANLTQVYPLLKSLGSFHLKAETEILDDAWRVAEMGIPNNHFRLHLIYPERFQQSSADNESVREIIRILKEIYYSIYSLGQMSLLYGKETDFINYQNRYEQPIHMFINDIRELTVLNFKCNMDPATIQQSVDDLVERIQGAKKANGPLAFMSNGLKGYYQSVQTKIKALMQANPPPPATQLAQMQKDLATLDGYIQQLDQFISSL